MEWGKGKIKKRSISKVRSEKKTTCKKNECGKMRHEKAKGFEKSAPRSGKEPQDRRK